MLATPLCASGSACRRPWVIVAITTQIAPSWRQLIALSYVSGDWASSFNVDLVLALFGLFVDLQCLFTVD